MWKQYGDAQMLRDFYPGMRRYARFMQRRCGKRQLLSSILRIGRKERKFAVNRGQAYGEWAEPSDVRPTMVKDIIFAHPEEATAYTCYIMELMEEIALHLGKADDAAEYRRYADGTRMAYQALARTKKYALDTDRQARLVRPLYFGLLDEEQKAYAQARLVRALENYGWRVGTGFLSTPLILYALAEIDIEAAYRLLENEEMPGWLFMPKNGAVTIWESWEGTRAQGGIASLNHYSKGAVCQWLFEVMCGVQIDCRVQGTEGNHDWSDGGSSGGNHITIAPRPGGRFAYAKLAYDSIFGRVESGWSIKDGKTEFRVAIPANATATVKLPDGRQFSVGSGEHMWQC
jgi:alpha-L-rhamnosidase